jgi:rhodanese-related sulfurtransferase
LESSAVGQAVRHAKLGFTNLKVIKDGVSGWKAAGLPMVKT